MLHPDTLTPGKAAGYPGGFAYYVVGRGGVLGDVDASVVVSAFAFFLRFSKNANCLAETTSIFIRAVCEIQISIIKNNKNIIC